MENIQYFCFAECVHNNGTGYAAYPCHLKNKNLKTNKETTKCYGNKCGFFEQKEKKNG